MSPSPTRSKPSASARTADEASFSDLGVPQDLVAALDRDGITAPFEIQSATIPDAMAGRDVLGRAPTGSGKTLAFGLPMVANLKSAKPRRPTGLILSPTRELAEQIRRDLEPLAKARGLAVLAVYGGVGFGNQLKGLRNGDDLVVATPGRLVDLIQQGEIFLDQVASVVVDEADRMADMGFLPVVKDILDLTNKKRQTVMFSATLGKEVKVLTDRYQSDPVTHTVGSAEPDLSLVKHRFIKTSATTKVAITADVVSNAGPTIVFCRTRHGSDRLARQLSNAGLKTAVIHGNRSQNQRDAALRSFTQGKAEALVATDVAARGIHVDGVACVVHFDPPAERADYVHRSGRTARAGASGEVVSLINASQERDAKKLQKQLSLAPDFEDTPDIDFEAFQAESRKRSIRRAEVNKKKGGKNKGGAAKGRTRNRSTRSDSRDGNSSRSSSGSKSSRPSSTQSSNRQSSNGQNSARSKASDSDSMTERSATERPVRRSSSILKKGTKKRRPSRRDDRDDSPSGRRSGKPKSTKRSNSRSDSPSSSKNSDGEASRSTRSGSGSKKGGSGRNAAKRGTPSKRGPANAGGGNAKSGKGKSSHSKPGKGKAKPGKAKAKTTKRSGKPRPPKRKKGGNQRRKSS